MRAVRWLSPHILAAVFVFAPAARAEPALGSHRGDGAFCAHAASAVLGHLTVDGPSDFPDVAPPCMALTTIEGYAEKLRACNSLFGDISQDPRLDGLAMGLCIYCHFIGVCS